jgi:hypothetical protein
MDQIRKALVAALMAAAALLPQVLEDGNVSSLEVLNLFGAALAAGYAVYKVTNAPSTPSV